MSPIHALHTHAVPSVAAADKSQPIFPLAIANDGYSNPDGDREASSTCLCGSVQFAFPTAGPNYLGAFMCHCSDCRKITASMFATNCTIANGSLKTIRGAELVKTYSQSTTVGSPRSGHAMTNFFCSNCGTLLYRQGPLGVFMRVGTVDDFALHETNLRPTTEYFTKDRVGWLKPVEGAKQVDAF